MNGKIIIPLFLLVSLQSFSQGLRVLITEMKTGKRVVLMAENKTQDTLNVLLMVDSEGYRRSATKPVVKNIPPQTKVPMITLIELSNVPSEYTYDLIINQKEKKISLETDKQAKDIEKILNGKLVLFTMKNCEKCQQLSSALDENRISHRDFDISDNQVIYRQFMAFISDQLTVETRIRFPIIWNKDKVIFSYQDLEEIVLQLQNVHD
jgi:glutaredoxin